MSRYIDKNTERTIDHLVWTKSTRSLYLPRKTLIFEPKKPFSQLLYFTDPRNTKLESMLTKDVPEYKETETLLMQSFGKTTKRLFGEHYKNLKPTLDYISKSRSNAGGSGSVEYGTHLKEFNLHDHGKTNAFFNSDVSYLMQNLDGKKRDVYYKSLNREYPCIPQITRYKDALGRLEGPGDSVFKASEYFKHNRDEMSHIVEINRLRKIETHPDLPEALDYMSSHLDVLSDVHLDVITYYLSLIHI